MRRRAVAGGADRALDMNFDVEEHERENCPERIVACDWVDVHQNNDRCLHEMRAKHRAEHRKQHLAEEGVLGDLRFDRGWTSA